MEDKQKISEEQLKDVAGGTSGPQCRFTANPNHPIRVDPDGTFWAQCHEAVCSKIYGLGTCPCHGTSRCIDGYHRMTKVSGVYWPSPRDLFNHSAKDKGTSGRNLLD